jgi:hypothetical protein
VSENITHTGIFEDSIRLMLAGGEVCAAFEEVAREHHAFARLGSLTRSGDLFTVDLLAKYGANWPEDKDAIGPKLGFVIGWLTHRAADRQMKPIFRAVKPANAQKPTECSVYHDAFVFHEVFADGTESPYHPAALGGEEALAPGFDTDALKTVVQVLVQQALIEMHTFNPDRDHIETWLEKLHAQMQRFYVDVDRYAEALANPDPDKVRRYITEVNFYDAEDAIIAAARAAQRGEDVGAEQIRAAATAEAHSHYAQALKLAYGYLLAASALFTGEISEDEACERFDIGKPGRDGKSV